VAYESGQATTEEGTTMPSIVATYAKFLSSRKKFNFSRFGNLFFSASDDILKRDRLV